MRGRPIIDLGARDDKCPAMQNNKSVGEMPQRSEVMMRTKS